MDFLSAPQYHFSRLLFERGLALLYGLGFLNAINQFLPLLGSRGLVPVPTFLHYVNFKRVPSLFHWHYSDTFLLACCWLGLLLSLLLVFGLSASLPIVLHILIWLLLYGLYLSLTNVGQNFYGFGWESMLCEAGFFMAFMGAEWVTPSWIPILILRWMLFRTEMGAGLIKVRGDKAWKDLTALYYHHETQPMPNPLSRLFHHMPKVVLRQGVVFSHFVQLIAPLFLFAPQPLASVAGVLIILHQLILVVAGNYSWLNWLTILLGVLAINDPFTTPAQELRPLWFESLQWGIGLGTLVLSYRPLLNLFSRQQKMNYCWNRFHLVGAYGAFGSVTKKRYEIVVEGSDDGISWKEYEFKGKPTRLDKIPRQYAPYHLRLDWMMWFLPFSVLAGEHEIYVMEHEPWFLRLIQKLLSNDKSILKLLSVNPFPARPPRFIRCRYYHYQFTSREEKKISGNIWKRSLMGEYLPALSLEAFGDEKQV